nr:50S ribosome-binding GTPase [Oscillospiraceae bacterium]
MGLTANSTGSGVLSDIRVEKSSPDDKVIVIAGNPNVGKSTVFNGLTGLHQHTGNWPGKTVSIAQGSCKGGQFSYVLVDVPGTYSLLAHSAEEEVARNFICFGKPDAAVVVCDATCLERSLNLALQVMEICPKTLVCVNLLDEAKRRNISVDLEALEKYLGVPVVGTSAHKRSSLKRITDKLDDLCGGRITPKPRRLRYIKPIEQAVSELEPALGKHLGGTVSPRWLALRMLDNDRSLAAEIGRFYGKDPNDIPEVSEAVERARGLLAENGITSDCLKDRIVSC